MPRPPEQWRPSLVRDYSNRIAAAAVKLTRACERYQEERVLDYRSARRGV